MQTVPDEAPAGMDGVLYDAMYDTQSEPRHIAIKTIWRRLLAFCPKQELPFNCAPRDWACEYARDPHMYEYFTQCADVIEAQAREIAQLHDQLAAQSIVKAAMTIDSDRLDSLDGMVEAYGFEGTHEGNRWVIEGPFRTVREAIDQISLNKHVADLGA